MLTRCGSIGNARTTNIAGVKRRKLPVVRRSAANANGSKNEAFSKPVNVTNKPNPNTSQTNTELEPEGCHHTLPQALSRDKDQFPLTKVEVPFLASDQFPPTMEAASFQANALHTKEEGNSPVRDPSPHTSLAGCCLVSGPFRLTTAVEPCRTPNRFLLTTPEVHCLVINPFLPTTPGVSCRAPTNLSLLITVAEISHLRLLPRTTPTLTTGLPTMKLRRE